MRTLDDIRPGQSIGRYEFLVPIAKGGMAAVWAARLKGSRGFAKTVAIKTMLPTLSDDVLFEQMFLDEAQLAAQIHHPNVVEIMDLGEEGDVLYQVMEYVDGESLATILRSVSRKGEPIPLDIAVRIVFDACNGLHAAHELKHVDGKPLSLVHRDISPQNILVGFDGVVKIVDFGVAKAAGRTASETTAGQIKGKAPYMSPEQATGGKIDRRTDVFALGIVLYQVTTGKHPFRGENDLATLHAILHRNAPSPRFVDPKFPRPLEAALLKALSRDPEKRFATTAEMAAALSRVFAPTHRRIEVADIGQYVQGLLGENGDKRREALREAIQRADMRGANPLVGENSGSVLLPLADIGQETSGVSTGQIPHMAATERIDTSKFAGLLRQSIPEAAGADGRASAPSPVSGSTGAVVSSDPDAPRLSEAEPPPAASSSKKTVGIAAAIAMVAVVLGIVALVLLRGATPPPVAASPRPPASEVPAVAQPSVPPPSTSATAALTPDAGPVYDIETISEPVRVPPVGQPVKPAGPAKPPASAKTAAPPPVVPPPPTTAAPTSTWKPPPVGDPGF